MCSPLKKEACKMLEHDLKGCFFLLFFFIVCKSHIKKGPIYLPAPNNPVKPSLLLLDKETRL